MKLKKYPKYKGSGVAWLGDVPENWDVERIKFFVSINDETLPETTDPEFEFYYVDIGSVDAVKGIINKEEMLFESAPSRARRRVKIGDIIVSTVRTYLRAIAPVSNENGAIIVSTGFAVIRPRKVASKYLSYALREQSFIERIVSRSVGVSYPAINASDVGNILITLPSDLEQTAIANFLDHKTNQLDTLIAKKQALIELLKEKRTALISRTVTRGLPADVARELGLEPHTRFKDSGVEWLGEVPVGWELCKLKRISISRCDGPFGSGLKSEHYSDEGVRVVRLQNLRFAQFDNSDAAYISLDHYKKLGDHGVIPGDLLIAGLGDESNPVGRACVAPPALETAMVKADCFRFRLDSRKTHPLYIALQLSTTATALAGALATGTTRGRMNLTLTENREVIVPPFPEQTAIATYLDRETAKIDKLIEKIQTAIERLQEYRTALITAAVTGKIDVRDWTPDKVAA